MRVSLESKQTQRQLKRCVKNTSRFDDKFRFDWVFLMSLHFLSVIIIVQGHNRLWCISLIEYLRHNGPETQDNGPETRDNGPWPDIRDNGPEMSENRPETHDNGPETHDNGLEMHNKWVRIELQLSLVELLGRDWRERETGVWNKLFLTFDRSSAVSWMRVFSSSEIVGWVEGDSWTSQSHTIYHTTPNTPEAVKQKRGKH